MACPQESQFFQKHPVYRATASTLGTQYLSKTLNGILMQHIRDCLPEIKGRINTMVVELSHQVRVLRHPSSSLLTPSSVILHPHSSLLIPSSFILKKSLINRYSIVYFVYKREIWY